MQRNCDRDRRIVAFELHSACNEQIIELVHMQRLTRLPEKQRARLCDGPVAKTMTDGFDIGADRRNAAALVNVSYRPAST